MKAFNAVLEEHSSLLKRQDNLSSKRIAEFITRVRVSGAEIYAAKEREQLRAILRYWATVYSEKPETKVFPNIELSPAGEEPPGQKLSREIRSSRGFFPVVLIIVLVFLLVQSSIFNFTDSPPTSTPTLRPSAIPNTLIPAPTQTALPPLDTPAPEGINIVISSPDEGQNVLPEFIVSGSYEKLIPDWTIHLIIQPIASETLYYSSDSYFTIPDGEESGEWNILVDLGSIIPDDSQERLLISAIVLVDEQTRSDLIENAFQAMRELPGSALRFKQERLLNKGAFVRVQEERILFSSSLLPQRELVYVNIDGGDLLQITFTENLDEIYPAISPDGSQIAYVEVDKNETPTVRRLILAESNGENPRILFESPHFVRHPAWSPDGSKIAFNQTEGNFTSLFVYFLGDEALVEENPQRVPVDTSLVRPSWLSESQIITARLVLQTGDDDKTWGLSAVDISTGESETVYNEEKEEESPSVSTVNRQQIAFVVIDSVENNQNIYTYEIGTASLEKLTTDNIQTNPVWGLDGSIVYYEIEVDSLQAIWGTNLETLESIVVVKEAALHPSVGFVDTFIPIDLQ